MISSIWTRMARCHYSSKTVKSTRTTAWMQRVICTRNCPTRRVKIRISQFALLVPWEKKKFLTLRFLTPRSNLWDEWWWASKPDKPPWLNYLLSCGLIDLKCNIDYVMLYCNIIFSMISSNISFQEQKKSVFFYFYF